MLGDTLDWPWFTDDHRRYATKLVRWAEQNLTHLPHDDVDQACRARVRLLGEAGFLKAAVPKPYGGRYDALDMRTLCLAAKFWVSRWARRFRVRNAGARLRRRRLSGPSDQGALPPASRAGKTIAAFALSEPEAGSDVAAHAMTARPDGNDHVRLDGERPGSPTAASRTSTSCSPAPAKAPGARGPVGVRGRCRYARTVDCGAHRGDRAASARDACVRPRAGSG